MAQKRRRRLQDDRYRQRETTLARYGPNYFSDIAKKSAQYRDPRKAKLNSWKYWHPERLNEEGEVKQEFVEQFLTGLKETK